jgi:2-keto-4-pentenoate hydratase/2-oxohepta-3-ene-1,7-dioic acid hydratase in catechol pathway
VRFATLTVDGAEVGVVGTAAGWVPLSTVDSGLSGDLSALVALGLPRAELDRIAEAAEAVPADRAVPAGAARFAPPYRHPRLIWGIGLNYREHARDLHESAPDEPASFIKGDQTVIGHEDPIVLPAQSRRVTSEAELGLVFGRRCRDVPPEEALDALFGVTAVLDQTAEDILERNPRYLTRSKNFPTFFSFGPVVVTLDEFLPGGAGTLASVEVETSRNGTEFRRNAVANMIHGPAELVSFHSRMMPFLPGDILSTGTPGALVVASGDVVESRVGTLPVLRNPVVAAGGDALAGGTGAAGGP